VLRNKQTNKQTPRKTPSSLRYATPWVTRRKSFWATVCKTVCSILSDHCLSCLSVTLVYCDQTVGWIKMKLGLHVGLGPGHIVLDGDPAPFPLKGHSPQFSAHICLWPNGWVDKDATWYEGIGLGPGHIVLDEDATAPRPKKGNRPQFSAHVYCDQTVTHLSCC